MCTIYSYCAVLKPFWLKWKSPSRKNWRQNMHNRYGRSDFVFVSHLSILVMGMPLCSTDHYLTICYNTFHFTVVRKRF